MTMDLRIFDRQKWRQKQAALFILVLVGLSAFVQNKSLLTALLFLPSTLLSLFALSQNAYQSSVWHIAAFGTALVAVLVSQTSLVTPWGLVYLILLAAFLSFDLAKATALSFVWLVLVLCNLSWVGDNLVQALFNTTTLSSIAFYSVLAIALRSLLKRIEFLERYARDSLRADPMTGLANREALLDEMESALQINQRYGLTSSLLLLKVHCEHPEHIKERALNRCLLKWVEVWKSRIRQTDKLCRLEHQTFVIVLSGTTDDQAAQLAEDLLEASLAYDLEGGDAIDLAIQVRECKPDTSAEVWLSELISDNPKISPV